MDESTEEEPIYQYYTIVSDPEMFLNESNETISENVTFIKEEDSDNIMLLSLEQDEQVFLPKIELNQTLTEDDEITDVKFLTVENGQMYVASTSSSSVNEDANYDNTEILEDNNFENDTEIEEGTEQIDFIEEGSSDGDNFTTIQLADGTCAFIEKHLWQSFLIDNVGEEEEKTNKPLQKKDKKYPCSFDGCDKSYSTSHHLTVHYRSHTGNKPYTCVGCEKSFVTSYSLKAHLRIHTGETPYSCSDCPKQFKTSGDLQKHIRTHTGEKPFVCPIIGCGRSFTTSNIRKVHIRSHTGERPYACTHPGCGKAFASATNFKNHMRIHSGEKPYACVVPGCGKRFTEYSSLFKHKVVHKPIQPLKCEYCNQVCKHENTLKAHKQAMHKVVMTEDGTEIRLSKSEADDSEERSHYYILTRDKTE